MIETEYESNFNAVIIRIIKERYLLNVKDVKEIFIPGDKIVPVPLSDKSIVGLIDIRGDIYSIISLRQMIYSNEINDDLNEHSRILLLERDNLKIALLVDSIIGISEVPYSIFTTKKSIIETNINSKLIKSIGVMNDMAYILLDLESLISPLLFTDISKTRNGDEVEFKPLPKIKTQKLIKTQSKPRVKKVSPSKVKVSTSTKKKPKSIKPVSELKNQIILSENQHDTLKEIGNIGSGNAITALSRLIKKKIDVSLTDVGIISFDNLSAYLGDSNQKVCGIFSTIENTSTSTILQVFDLIPLLGLVEDLSENKLKTPIRNIKTKSDLDELTISTIKEMGNIMAGHYVSAIADLLGTKMLIDVPDFALSTTASLANFLKQEQKANIKFLISIKTSMNVVDLKLNGMFFFIPDIKTIESMFKKLNIENELISDQLKSKSTTNQFETEILSKINLTELQRDALQEVGNIGAGNAANALAIMLNKRVDIDIPIVEMVELDKFAKNISKRNIKLFVSWSNIIGKAKATVISIFKLTDILKIGSIITDGEYNYNAKDIKSVKDFNDIFESAISELGHILASHYASAIGDLLDIKMMTEVPDLSIDTGKQLFKILQDEIGLIKKLSLVITTNVIISDIKITGTFLYIPDLESLQDLLDKLELFYD